MQDPRGSGGEVKGMTEEEYILLRDLVYRESGIVLKGSKRMTLHAKIAHRLSILGLASYRDYYDLIVNQPSREELFIFLSHVANNETYFLREITQLSAFTNLLGDLKKQKQKRNQNRITILSAGCSSGEELYTLNVMLMESGLFAWGWEVRLIGMDVSKAAIAKARRAVYPKNSFRRSNGSNDFVEKYFDREGERFVLRKPYRNNVEFIHGNVLLPESFLGLHDIDAIFCRNVLIYMNDAAIGLVAANFHGCLSDEGYLFVGLSESLLNKTELFVPEYRDGIICYRKNPSLT